MAVADHSGTPRGTLRVGANEATCLYVLPEVFGEYCRRYPPVQISIYRNFSYKIVEKLENGAVEIGILTLPIQSPSLKIQPIFRDKLMLMVSPKNPLAKYKVVPCQRDREAAAAVSKNWPHPQASRQVVSAVRHRIAGADGVAQHRHDQEFCGRRPGSFADQPIVCAR